MKTISLLLTLAVVPGFITRQAVTPQQAADELLAADRACSMASAKSDLITGIGAVFATDVAMMAPTGIIDGSQKAIDALKANPANAGAKAEWIPARVGISADGRHGFTAGFMTIRRADASVNSAKYLAYWEKQADGWHALTYKRVPAKTTPGAVEVTYLLPKAIVATKRDAAAIDRDRETLAEAERSFSKDAQTMGIGPAFKKYGSPDAMNLGGPDTVTFLRSNQDIGDSVGGGSPANTSPVNWGPEKTIIAASGDFGVTIGYINRNQPLADGKPAPGQAFFTIWQKDAAGVWKYIAE